MVAVTFVVGLALILLGLTGLWQLPGRAVVQGAPSWWFIALLVVGCLALVIRRRAPVVALIVGAGAFSIDAFLGGSIAGLLYFCELLYNAALVGSPRLRRVLWSASGILVVGPAAVTFAVTRDVQWAVLVGLQQSLIYFGPLWWAKDVRTTTELAAIAAARADAVEQLVVSERRESRRVERDALARDLHDAVASHLSAIALHSGGALATPAEPAKDRAALATVRGSALESMREMHSLIALLRDPDQVERPIRSSLAPGIAEIRDLVEQTRRTGTDVELSKLDSTGAVPARVGLVAYRITQEALANAAKHARGQSVTVEVSRSGHILSVVVHNPRTVSPGVGGRISPEPPGSGLGLAIMQERAAAVGGTLQIDDPPDGWTVIAHLPLMQETAP